MSEVNNPKNSVELTKFSTLRIGLDSSVIPLKNNLYLVQSVDYFYPLCDDAELMGKIAFANVVSDVYSTGVVHIDELKIIISIPTELTDEEQSLVVPQIIKGFKESASTVNCKLTIENITVNPWCIIGGIASAVCTKDEMIFPVNSKAGDLLILTKPLGVQLATNAPIWMKEDSENWKKIKEHLTEQDVNEAHQKALKSMIMLNHTGAQLMHKYKAHAATDITGFGLVGHAENLLKYQEDELDFIITRMPVIKGVKKIAEILNRHQKLITGKMVETSGGLFISLPEENAQKFCDEFHTISGSECWIVGHVVSGTRKALIQDLEIIEV
ncbi:unnamed protein product [Diamesa tonsa]